MSAEYVFINVNEEGVPYDTHDSLSEALAVQQRFPEDVVMVALRTSFYARTRLAELERHV